MNTTTALDSITRTAWLREARWGAMFHYIDLPASSNIPSTTTSAEWNRRVDSFRVDLFAEQVREMGAGYVIFTLGQNTGHFCSPNSTYDEITRIRPSKLSERDLIAEIAVALQPDVRVIAYLPSHAPSSDPEAVRRFRLAPPWSGAAWGLPPNATGIAPADERLTEFQRLWESVIAEWGARWGDLVSGWWIDGCYFADRMYSDPEGPNFESFARALRTGNDQRVLAFNSGTDDPFRCLTPEQDYTGGEISTKFPVANKWDALTPVTNGMQTHVLSYLGDWWGQGAPRFPDAFVEGYTQLLTASGGVLTWDVPILANGTIPSAFLQQLRS